MNKWLVIAVSITLALSFVLVYALSPSDSEFLARYTPANYVTIASFDVPLDGSRTVELVSSLSPLTCKTVKLDIDQLEIRVNKNIGGNLDKYLRENMDVQLHFLNDGTHLNLEIHYNKPVRSFMAETFGIIRFFDDYARVIDQHAEILICVPMNYEFV